MALQNVPNLQGPIFGVWPQLHLFGTTTNRTMDAAGESVATIGHVFLSTGPGTSKTISSAGGKIHWRHGQTATFANAGTTLRVGINDVGATGLEDGTHDVFDDLVGGTDTITTNVVNTATMSSGTKTIAHGDQIAVVLEMTARGGADSLIIHTMTQANTGVSTPYCTVDSGAGPATQNGVLPVTLTFDDGTIGWFGHDSYTAFAEQSAAFSNASTPDEVALVFQVPFKCSAMGIVASPGAIAAADDFEMILYSDPLGTPVAERPIAQDMSLVMAVGSQSAWERPFTSSFTLNINTNYAIALRPTTANTITYYRLNFNTGNEALRAVTMVGTSGSLYSRSDQTGAFSSQDTTLLPCFAIRLGQLSDDVSSGGGMTWIIGG